MSSYVISVWPPLLTLKNISLSDVEHRALSPRRSSTSKTCRAKATQLVMFFQLVWYSITCCSDILSFPVRNTMKFWIKIELVNLTLLNQNTRISVLWRWTCSRKCLKKTHQREFQLKKPYNMSILAQALQRCKLKSRYKRGLHLNKSHTTHTCRG